MKAFSKVIPVIAGAAAGAIVALLVGHGGGKTVTDVVNTPSGAASGSSQSQVTAGKSSGLDINEIYKQDISGVVDIKTISISQGSNSFFGQSSGEKSEAEGAGVVYDKKGDILTDEHVIDGASSVKVYFQDGYSASAKVLGSDASTDVAVIRVDVSPAELHPIKFANSNTAQVGDPVVAIGSPFGLPGTTTAGIVSAVGRTITAPNNYAISGAIQTDAAINPGNSGGPLLDAAGEVVGLNDQIQTSSGDSAGVGFATPANADVQVANTIIAGKQVQHPWLGVSLQDAANGGAEISPSGNYTTDSVIAGSPAAKAGLKPGDVITAINGQAVTDSDALIASLSTYKPGDTVTLSVRRNGKTGKVKVKLGDRPATAPTAG